MNKETTQLESLRDKHPECPKCGEKSSLYISGVNSHEFKCHGEDNHEFTVDEEDLQ